VEGRRRRLDFPHDHAFAYPQKKAATEACCRIKIGRSSTKKKPCRAWISRTNSLRPIWRVLLHTKSLQQRSNPFSLLRMGLKRPHDEVSQGPVEPHQKKRKGFSVGPANLPDGTYRRKSKSARFLGPKAELTVSQLKR
jgi:hypothetical protein